MDSVLNWMILVCVFCSLVTECVRFQVLTAASMKFRVFWDVAQCSHDEVD
jgi:hypothetical protein